jgi:hypothetical protein
LGKLELQYNFESTRLSQLVEFADFNLTWPGPIGSFWVMRTVSFAKVMFFSADPQVPRGLKLELQYNFESTRLSQLV